METAKEQSRWLRLAAKEGWKAKGLRKEIRQHRLIQDLSSREIPNKTDAYELFLGDFREVGKKIPDSSVDWIVTDPPYKGEFIELYEPLGEFAARVLKPGGSLIAMVGQYYLPDVLRSLSTNLRYHWTLAYLTPGGQSPHIHARKVYTFWKPVLWFVKNNYAGDWVRDVVQLQTVGPPGQSNDNDKDYHKWGQSVSGMTDLMNRFILPGETVLDPYLGGGTTAVAAIRSGAMFIDIDVSEQCLDITRARLADLYDEGGNLKPEN